MSKILSVPNVQFLDTLRFAQLRKNQLSWQPKIFDFINKNVARNFLMYSDPSWGSGRRLDVRRRTYGKFQEKFFSP